MKEELKLSLLKRPDISALDAVSIIVLNKATLTSYSVLISALLWLLPRAYRDAISNGRACQYNYIDSEM